MAECIYRDAIYTAFANACTDVLERASEIDYIAGFSYEHVIEILDNIPTADVAPVVRRAIAETYHQMIFALTERKTARWAKNDMRTEYAQGARSGRAEYC